MIDAIRRIPSAMVVAVFYAVLLASSLLLGRDAAEAVAVVMLVALIVHCALRRTQRLNVFFYAAAPGAAGTLLHDVTGASQRWGLLLIPFVLIGLAEIDRDERSAPTAATD
jgi:hypothetical protein